MFDVFLIYDDDRLSSRAGLPTEEKVTLYPIEDWELVMNVAKDLFESRNTTVEVRDVRVRGRISWMRANGEKRMYIQIWEP